MDSLIPVRVHVRISCTCRWRLASDRLRIPLSGALHGHLLFAVRRGCWHPEGPLGSPEDQRPAKQQSESALRSFVPSFSAARVGSSPGSSRWIARALLRGHARHLQGQPGRRQGDGEQGGEGARARDLCTAALSCHITASWQTARQKKPAKAFNELMSSLKSSMAEMKESTENKQGMSCT